MDALQTLKSERTVARAAARTLAQRVKPGPWIALPLPTCPPPLRNLFPSQEGAEARREAAQGSKKPFSRRLDADACLETGHLILLRETCSSPDLLQKAQKNMQFS